MYALFELLCFRKKKLHCAFVDFEKAFDFVHMNSLFFMLVQNSICGIFRRIIQNMYEDVKSCIQHINEVSDVYLSEIGVRHGENVPPFLFSLYLNDLQSYLEQNNLKGVESVSKDIEIELLVYFKIILFLYADDTILLSESAEDLQQMLNVFSTYCDTWKLKVNVAKQRF